MSFMELFYALRPRMSWPWWLAALAVGAVLAAAAYAGRRRGRLTGTQAAAAVVLGIYLSLIFSYTVFARAQQETYAYELELFWSLELIRSGGRELLVESLYNVLMLLPVGLLLPVLLTRPGTTGAGLKAVALGFLCSALIETLQLVMKRGLFELNDLLHNTLGAAVGCGLYYLIKALRARGRGT